MLHHDVADLKLAKQGRLKIEWAGEQMPVLQAIQRRFTKERPLRGRRVSCCLHVTSETANLVIALKAGGADVFLCASNPLSTQDDVAASLVQHSKIPVFARRGEDRKRYYSHIASVLKARPHITMDDGADVISAIHRTARGNLNGILGGTEETTTGVIRLRSLEQQGALRYPVIAVNDAYTKHLFDNRYGTGQSTLDGIIRATNRLIAGTAFVVCGYGWCGRGVAMRAHGLGAHVIVTEVDPVRALEASLDGYQVMKLSQAVKFGEIFVTVTGDTHVIAAEHLRAMRDGAIISNAGHFDVEIDLAALKRMSTSVREVRPNVEAYRLRGGKRMYVLGQGRLVNLACAEGHPANVMDMSFANQALSAEYLVLRHGDLGPKVYRVPEAIDREIARLKLSTMGITIDRLTSEQQKYLASWELGT